MSTTAKVNLFEVVLGLSEALDLMSPDLADHHKRVAYIAGALAGKLGLPDKMIRQIVLAGAVHDIGGLTLEERINTLQFEDRYAKEHSEVGYLLLNMVAPLQEIAQIVRYHHIAWDFGKGKFYNDEIVPLASHIIHLADRIAVLIGKASCILEDVSTICERIQSCKGTVFIPEAVDAFMELSNYEYFWLDIASNSLDQILLFPFNDVSLDLSLDDLVNIARLFSRIVDFRSPLNASHSSGVARSAYLLSNKFGFSDNKCTMMTVAGYLHDLGKLAVPPAILEKPSKLTSKEFLIIKRHPYYTHSILSKIKSFNEITGWAAYHHERLDGSGYPFHLKAKDLPFESQIMAVADVFTAVTEDRPYRAGMKKSEVINLLNQLAKEKALNKDIVSTLVKNYDEINQNRTQVQKSSLKEYQSLLTPLSKLLSF